ncbi:MAG: tetratricopeptide repeat protein, partial [Polyangia bacterium]
MFLGRRGVKFILAAGALAIWVSPARADEDLPAAYLVAPFQNASPVKQLDWMSSALAVTVAEKLEALPALRPVYGPKVLDGFEKAFDPEEVARRAHDAGAKWVFSGEFARPDWKSDLKVRLYVVVEASDQVTEPTLRLVAEVGSVGERKNLIAQLDDNLLALLRKAEWPLDADALAQLARKPTRDLYAFTLYGRALDMFYGLGAPRDLKKAQKTLKRALNIDPKFAEAHRLLGLTWLDAGERAKASSQFSYALDLKPGYWSAQASLVRIYRESGNRARAVELCQKALEARPYDVEMRETLGELEWEGADLDAALADLIKVVAIEPRNLKARRTLALIYAARGETADLAAELERVQDLAPDDLDVKLDLGSAYLRMGRNDRAISAYEDVLKKQPKNIQALKLVGDCYRRQKLPEKAIVAYQRVRKLAPEDPRPYFLLGAAYEEAGDDTRAEAIFQDAQQFKRYLGEAWTNLGSIAYRRGDLATANWYLSRAVVRAPER